MTTTNNNLGLYLHIPFCVRKCSYCDFLSFGCSDVKILNEYAAALIKEISNKKEKLDVNSELSRKQIDDNNQVESKRRKLEETVESETSRSSDSSEADWSD